MRSSDHKAWLLCSAALSWSFPALAGEQTQDLTKLPAELPLVGAPASQAGTGVKLGPFSVDGAVAGSEPFSDNVFVTKNAAKSDWISTLSPGITASLGGAATGLNLRAGAEIGRYARYTSENYDDIYIGGDGRLRLGASTTAFGGARYDWKHESRESPDAVNGTEPTRYQAGDY